jgi:hypothetical protein
MIAVTGDTERPSPVPESSVDPPSALSPTGVELPELRTEPGAAEVAAKSVDNEGLERYESEAREALGDWVRRLGRTSEESESG